jgi:predicted nucleotidyltransferase component of viral defense system
MDFSDIRRITITALFSDDFLYQHLVLKGGTALSLIYGLTSRTSIDLDFSMASDFENVAVAEQRMFRALRDRFDAEGYVVFDERLDPKPRLDGEDIKPWWGGYELRFKLIDRDKFEKLKHRPEKLSMSAMVTGLGQDRVFTVDLSKHEYVHGSIERELDHFSICVYTPEMIAIEKLRAICQQMEAYEHRGQRAARARDFYDIYTVLNACQIDLGSVENHALVRHIFAAKQVPLSFLRNVSDEREFHRTDWPAVVNTTEGQLEPFDYYFDCVLRELDLLKTLWVE